MNTSSPTATGPNISRSVRLTRALIVLAATSGAVIVWVVAARLAGVDLTIRQGDRAPTEIGIALVVVTALLAGLAGWGLLALLERRTSRPAKVWPAVASVVMALSLVLPLTSDATTGAHLTLALMHLVVGAVLILGLRQTLTGSRPA